MGIYHDLYIQSDMLLLADVFYNFRDICLDIFKLDIAQIFAVPGLVLCAALKFSGVLL